MRLLHFNQSGRLMLTDFRDKAIPQYAILSHRWGHPDSEILFQDIGRDDCKDKDGYRKIEFCARQLAEDQLQYFWIDTCCIDKWNLSELSYSINSMFRWYKDAARCYVFLSDVSASTATEIRQQKCWELSFRTSEWFTRGWTLQELIAPRQVEFFSRQGQRIGDKTSLAQLVHEITDIPHKVLQNCPLDRFSIAERKTWAVNRKTTEEEDIVYCLLGILNVSMPVSYGEGKEIALRRLQMMEEEATGSAPFILPYCQNDEFVGWDAQLAELEIKLFSAKQTTTTLAITGQDGTGKSELALELAYRTRQKNKNCSIFWIDASDMDSIIQSYASIAQKLNIPGSNDEDFDVQVKLRLEAESARQCLLIFDNAENVSIGVDGLSTNFMDYLPQSELCSIIFITADSDTTERLAVQNVVELQGLAPVAAQSMLENHLSTLVSESQQQEAKLLLNELCYVPLAIAQAAAYINTTCVTLLEYKSLYSSLNRQNETTLQSKDPVAATLLISIEQIHCSNALASDYLFLAACVDRKDVPLDLFPAPSAREREDAMKVLSRYKLVTRRPAESAIEVHRLVHHAVREWLQKQELLGLWTRRAITRLFDVFPLGSHVKRSKWRRLFPHTQFVLSHSRDEGVVSSRLLLMMKTALALYRDGWYNEAEKLFVQVKTTREKALGKEHPDTLTSMEHLALTYRLLGRLNDAGELLLPVVEARKRVLGEEHRSTLNSIANLSMLYSDQGRSEEAEELELQVIEARKRVLGDEHPATLTSIANLASTYHDQGRLKEAEELEVEVVAIKRRVLGDEHPDTLTSIGNLALVYASQEQWKRSEELLVQVLEAGKRVLGKEHPHTLVSMVNLAFNLRSQYRDEEALTLLENHFQLSRQILGEGHPHTKLSLEKIIEWKVKK